MPADVMFGMPVEMEDDKEPADYAQQLVDKLGVAYAEVRANLQGAQECQKMYYDVNARWREFEVGDLVYRRKDAWKPGLSRKLCPLYTGLFVVTKVLSPCLYRVEDWGHAWVWHHDKLKICNDREIPYHIRRKRHEVLRMKIEDEGGKGAQAASIGSSISEDGVNDTVSTVTLELEVNHENDLLAGLSVSEDEANKSVPVEERRASGMEDLDQTGAYLGDDSPEKQGKDDLEELAEKVDCWAEDYWLALEEWELEKLFKEPGKPG